MHRYREIEEFPTALNNSQMWNWGARLFITDAKANLTAEEKGGPPSKYTQSEIDALEKTLKEHEAWLGEWVQKQKAVPMNEDPVILTSEMRARAKTLENHLQRLAKRKIPKKKPATSSSSSSSTPESTATQSAGDTEPTIRDEL
jgi:hypoxia up-regulated 1